MAITLTAAGTASAATPHHTDTTGPHHLWVETDWMHLPHTIKRGTAVIMSLWYTQNSPDTEAVDAYALTAWSKAATSAGLTMMFVDPSTGKWTKPHVDPPCSFILFPQSGKPVLIRPNTVSHVTMRIAISKTARLGTWNIDAQVAGYTLLTKQGTPDNATDMILHRGEYTFNVVK